MQHGMIYLCLFVTGLYKCDQRYNFRISSSYSGVILVNIYYKDRVTKQNVNE